MAIIQDKSYSLTWGDYFSMDRNTYSLKKRIIALRDHGLERKATCVSSSLDALKGDIQWLSLNVKQNPTLSQDQSTSQLLKNLYSRIDQYYRNSCHQEWRASEGLTSSCDGGNYDLSSLSSNVGECMVACGDNLTLDIEVHLPDPMEVFCPEPSGGVSHH